MRSAVLWEERAEDHRPPSVRDSIASDPYRVGGRRCGAAMRSYVPSK